jgi:glycosyltransferase AglD
MKKLLICLPIRNEEEILKKNVEILVDFLYKNNGSFSWQVILSINGSIDNSINIAQELSNKYEKVDYLEIKEGGKGRAIKYCFDKSKNEDILMYMDIDLAVSLNYLNNLIEPILEENYDFVISTRALKGYEIKRSFFRAMISRFYNILSKLFFNHKIKDLQCGFKAIKKEAYDIIRPHLKNNQWFFDTEWVILSQFYNFKIKEIPVDWQDNRYLKRKSAIKTFSVAWQFIVSLIKLKIRMINIKK